MISCNCTQERNLTKDPLYLQICGEYVISDTANSWETLSIDSNYTFIHQYRDSSDVFKKNQGAIVIRNDDGQPIRLIFDNWININANIGDISTRSNQYMIYGKRSFMGKNVRLIRHPDLEVYDFIKLEGCK